MTEFKVEKGVRIPTFKIEKGVRIPVPSLGRRAIYPWDEMVVGDSFPVTEKKYFTLKANVSYRNRTHKDQYFIIRRFEDGYRVWRTK